MPRAPQQPDRPPAVAGTVAIVGRPNVGKSTFMNQALGQKLAIVTPKPQTTRNRIVGIWTGAVDDRAGQIVFVDTPGVHAARSALNKFMVREAMEVMGEVDAILFMVEADPRGTMAALNESERRILERLVEGGRPVVLVLNKVDLVPDKSKLLPILAGWQERYPFVAIVPIAARRSHQVERVIHELLGILPTGAPLYDADQLTDRSERFLTAELVREQLFHRLREELPYAVAVVIDQWQERPDRGDVVIDASIMVERDSQKSIVVGQGGAMIRDVGTAARAEISKLLGRPAHLRLFAKVDPDWTSSQTALQRLGYHGTR